MPDIIYCDIQGFSNMGSLLSLSRVEGIKIEKIVQHFEIKEERKENLIKRSNYSSSVFLNSPSMVLLD